MNWKAFFQGLGVAVLGGAAASAATVVTNRLGDKTAPPVTGKTVGAAAASGAVTTLIAYLAKSPLTAPTTDQKAGQQ